MKLLKLSLFAVLMTFAMMSCKDDTTSPKDDSDYNFTIITEPPSAYNIIVKTYIDDVLIDSIRVYEEDNEIRPKGFSSRPSYITNAETLYLSVNNYDDESFKLNIGFQKKSFAKGEYIFKRYTSTYYANPALALKYLVESGKLLITDIKYLDDIEKQYFISGECSIIFKKLENENHTTSVKVIFENLDTFVGEDYS